jgi:hypothetical protein
LQPRNLAADMPRLQRIVSGLAEWLPFAIEQGYLLLNAECVGGSHEQSISFL